MEQKIKHSPDALARWQLRRGTPPLRKGREHRYAHQYGLSPLVFLAMLREQDEKCAICDGEFGYCNDTARLDHDHETGAVRGFLCDRCNTLEGMLDKAARKAGVSAEEIARRVVSYLKNTVYQRIGGDTFKEYEEARSRDALRLLAGE